LKMMQKTIKKSSNSFLKYYVIFGALSVFFDTILAAFVTLFFAIGMNTFSLIPYVYLGPARLFFPNAVISTSMIFFAIIFWIIYGGLCGYILYKIRKNNMRQISFYDCFLIFAIQILTVFGLSLKQ
jgi:hypothetical protein